MPRKSYIILSLILASVMASVAVPSSAFYNLLQNPGFEDGVLDPWEADWGGDAWVVISTVDPHTGTYHAYGDAGDGEAYIWQDIDPPRCAEYLEFWYKGGAVGDLEVGIYYSDGTEYWEDLSNTDIWTFVHIDLDTTKLVETVEVCVDYHGYFHVDDFDLEARVDLPVGGELTPLMTPIPNPVMVIAVMAVASAVVLGYRFTKR